MSNKKYRNGGKQKASKPSKPSAETSNVKLDYASLPDVSTHTPKERVFEIVKDAVKEYQFQRGLAQLQEHVDGCQEELFLHRMEVRQRRETMLKGETPPTRWQVSPGIACKIRDQLAKYEAKIEQIENETKAYSAAVLDYYGYTPKGQPKTDQQGLCVSAGDETKDEQQQHLTTNLRQGFGRQANNNKSEIQKALDRKSAKQQKD